MIGRATIAAAVLAGLSACASSRPTIPSVAQVDLSRFMGDWYVIAHIPAFPEREAYNAIESYRLDARGRIQTTFQFRKGSFSAPLRTMRPIATVRPDSSNSVWDMQFVWPIKAEYVIVELTADYRLTLIGRSKRDYLWIMARTPSIAPADYERLLARALTLGYDTSKLRRVPQHWPESGPSARAR